ncbi:alkaline phosphatase [Oceanobacillus massiliensis]|uniref:alkaline phosphatase n=1 Tax=Oceanobacillus massiliensis TaxID=1465765 RepID=UPI000289C6C4|nr:alkaline phosphatase [Oceanobacillus massiliensis]
MSNKKIGKKLIPIAAVATIAFGSMLGGFSQDAEVEAKKGNKSQGKIKNVIFMIGDGMGPTYNTAYRSYQDDKTTPYMEKSAFDQYLVGMQETYPWDEEESITDSAAAATAMSAGIKTYNGAIGVDKDKKEVETVLESAKTDGKATGLVSTSQVNHATPASFGAHDESRNNYNDIADDYLDEKINGKPKIDVILGGGTSYFERTDRNLTQEFKDAGFSYVTSKEELLNDKNEQVLGLFAPVGLNYTLDRPEEQPSLADMTNTALDRLSEDKDGFFLMVEGSQVDWAGHDNDIVAAMSEMKDFEGAFKRAVEFAEEDGETLVITTADHSTGGFAMGINGEYKWDPAPLLAAERTPDFMAAEIASGADTEEVLNQYIDLELTSEEIQSVKDAAETTDVTAIDNAIERIFDVRSGTGWTTGGHDGVDVNVYAYGPQADKFAGLHDNHEVGEMVIDVLKNHRKGR